VYGGYLAGGSFTMENSVFSASYGGWTVGLQLAGATDVNLTHCEISAEQANTNQAMTISAGTIVGIFDSYIHTIGFSLSLAQGVISNGDVVIANSRVISSAALGANGSGITRLAGTIDVRGSVIKASGPAVNASATGVTIATSQIIGSISGTPQCVFSYNASLTALSSTCN
jgi:hypothetical protein